MPAAAPPLPSICADSRIHDSLGIRDLNAAGAHHADGFQVLGSENASKSSGARADAAAVNQGGDSRHRFAHRADADDLRSCRGEVVSDLMPLLAESGPSTHHRCDLSLRFIGIEAPQRFGILDSHLVIDDIDPDRPVPPCPEPQLHPTRQASALWQTCRPCWCDGTRE